MKKLMFLSLAGFLMAACSVDPIESDEFNSLDAKVKSSQTESFNIPELVCAGEEAEFCLEFPQDYAGPNPKETNLLVQRKYMGDDPETEEVETEYWELVFHESADTRACFDHTFETAGDHDLRYKIGEGGFTEVTVTVENCNSCTNELISDLTCGTTNTLDLTFTAEEAGWIVIQGGLNRNTMIQSTWSNILDQNMDHPSVENSNANVTRWEGYVEACEEVMIKIEFEGDGYVDDWSAKRNDMVLGETEPQTCE